MQMAYDKSVINMRVLANITALEANSGAKLVNGCRPLIRYEGMTASCALAITDVERVFPNHEAEVEIAFIDPSVHKGKLIIGKEFELLSGSIVIAKGTITLVDESFL